MRSKDAMTSSTAVDHDAVTTLLADAQERGVYPGAVWAVGDTNGIRARGQVGVLDPAEPFEAMGEDTVFDIASLTKVTAVWSLIGHLAERDALTLDDRLDAHLADTVGHPLGDVTVHQLLTHTAGLPLRSNLKPLYGTDPDAIRRGVLTEALNRTPGETVDYTDRAALILGYLIEHLTAQPLDRVAADLIWRPLGMTSTRFGPLPEHLVARCAPTEADQETGIPLRGVAHDFSTRLLGGVCGISGAFSTADDLALFLRHMLNPDADQAAFGPGWIDQSLTVHTGGLEPARGLFWHPAPGADPAEDTWVHYGFTGTGAWLNRLQGRWALLLTNKVYYTRDREPLTEVRNTFRKIVFG
jgi:CubicO group peptidase (beta-lactamase class C family)